MRKCLWAAGAVVLGLMMGCRSSPSESPLPPRIVSFAADRPQISSGETAVLRFEAQGATEARLMDEAGVEIPLEGGPDSGQASVKPTRGTFYVLRVRSETGSDSAFVQVA